MSKRDTGVSKFNTDQDITVLNVDESDLPTVISEQFTQLKNLQKKTNAALKKAKEAQESAESARSHSAGWFQKKAAIEALQDATYDLAESQVSAAEAQKISFEYQEKLGKITQYLFALGVTNMAANRTVVRELELKLKGASKNELSELARREIVSVISQLKAQEDIMNKQNELTKIVKKHDAELHDQELHLTKSDSLISANTERNKEQDEQIAQQAEKDEEHDRLISANIERNKEQDEQIAQQAEKDEEHDRLISANTEHNKEQDEQIAQQAEKDEEHDRLISANTERNKEQDEQIAQQAEKDEEHDRLISVNTERNKEQDEQIANLVSKDNQQQKIIDDLISECDLLKQNIKSAENVIAELTCKIEKLEKSKSSKISTVISYIVAAIGVLAAFIQFFI